MNRDIDIPASGAPVTTVLGVFKYLAIRSADVAFQISFDGAYWQNAKQNDRWDKRQQAPLLEKVFFKALNGLAATVTLDFDTRPLGAQDTAVQNVQTVVLCNGGQPGLLNFPTAKEKVTGNNWGIASNNAVNVVGSNAVKIPGTNNGRKRKTITFVWFAGLPVVVTDANGLVFLYLGGAAAYQQYSFDVSDDFYVCGVGGANNNGFYYNEIYYAKANS
jgi:hypothetical protein